MPKRRFLPFARRRLCNRGDDDHGWHAAALQ
nr:MAG TPA: TMEM213 family [Caudoviricetes sp.]